MWGKLRLFSNPATLAPNTQWFRASKHFQKNQTVWEIHQKQVENTYFFGHRNNSGYIWWAHGFQKYFENKLFPRIFELAKGSNSKVLHGQLLPPQSSRGSSIFTSCTKCSFGEEQEKSQHALYLFWQVSCLCVCKAGAWMTLLILDCGQMKSCWLRGEAWGTEQHALWLGKVSITVSGLAGLGWTVIILSATIPNMTPFWLKCTWSKLAVIVLVSILTVKLRHLGKEMNSYSAGRHGANLEAGGAWFSIMCTSKHKNTVLFSFFLQVTLEEKHRQAKNADFLQFSQ